ncbi:MAG: class I SAM-dependent methyltransferase [Thermoguttaceae bacterium]
MARTAPLVADWYDHPRYYDIAFRDETRAEVNFIEAACQTYGRGPVRRLFEPACGTGRLVTELAARGYRVTGLDLNRPSLEFLRRRLHRRGLRATVLHGDMADFRLRQPVDAAFCTFDGFRHLLSESSARQHLQCVSDHLRPGGIYLLGFHLLPLDASDECIERWTNCQGRTRVTVTLRVLSTDRRRRQEQLRVSLLVRNGLREFRLRHDFPFRMYTAAQFRRLLKSVPSLELCAIHDFWYEMDQTFPFNDELSDSVFILRKLGGKKIGRDGKRFAGVAVGVRRQNRKGEKGKTVEP